MLTIIAPTKPTSSLEIMHQTLSEALNHYKNTESSLSKGLDNLEISDNSNNFSTLPHPNLFITKWIDYSNKYGLGYQLRDGSVGVYFNDSTSIILSANNL